MDVVVGRLLPMEKEQDHQYSRKEEFLRLIMQEAPQNISNAQTAYNLQHQSFLPEEVTISVLAQGLKACNSLHLPMPYQGDCLETRTYSHQQPPCNQKNPAVGSFPSNFGTPNLQPVFSDIGLPRFPIRDHDNPYASTFDQSLKGSSASSLESQRFDSSFSGEHVPVTDSIWSRTFGEKIIPRTSSYIHESSAEVVQEAQMQLVSKPVAGAPYDPLFDSIEPSSNKSKMLVEEQNLGINDTSSASRFSTRKGSMTELKAEVDELGDAATDADAGGAENESSQLSEKDWSPLIPVDTNVGEIEIDQVQSPGKS